STLPSVRSAQVWFEPATTALAGPPIATGVLLDGGSSSPMVLRFPAPSWPEPLAPQHISSPPPSSAQEWLPPSEIATTSVLAGSCGGIRPTRPTALGSSSSPTLLRLP